MNNYPNYQNPIFGQGCKNHVKQYFSSPMSLAAAILYTVSVVLSFVATMMFDPNELMSYIMNNELLAEFARDVDLGTMLSASTNIDIDLIGIAMIVGLFLLYFQSRSKSFDTAPRASFTIFRVIAIINTVIVSIFAVIMLLVFGLLIVALFFGHSAPNMLGYMNLSLMDYDDTAVFSTALLATILSIIFLVLVGTFTVMLVHCVSFNRYSKSLRRSLDEPYMQVKGAKTFGVLSIILGCLSVVSNLSVSTAFGFGVISALATLCSGAFEIIFGIMALRYVDFATKTNQHLFEQYQAAMQAGGYMQENTYNNAYQNEMYTANQSAGNYSAPVQATHSESYNNTVENCDTYNMNKENEYNEQ